MHNTDTTPGSRSPSSRDPVALNGSSLGALTPFYLVVDFVLSASSSKTRSVSDSSLLLLQLLVEKILCDYLSNDCVVSDPM